MHHFDAVRPCVDSLSLRWRSLAHKMVGAKRNVDRDSIKFTQLESIGIHLKSAAFSFEAGSFFVLEVLRFDMSIGFCVDWKWWLS